MDQKIRKLRSHPILDSLPGHAIRTLAPKVSIEHLAPGDILLEQGETAEAGYLVVSGELETQSVDPNTGKVQRRGRYVANDMIGDLEVYEQTPYRASVRAIKPTELIRIPASTFRRMMGSYPELREIFQARTTAARSVEGGIFFSFPDLRPDEHVIRQLRKHWIVPVRTLSGSIVLMLIVTALVGGIILLDPLWFRNMSQGPFLLLSIWGIIVLMLLGWFLWELIDWLNDYYIVTTHRIIHIEKVAFFFEERREAPIEKIQDVKLQLDNPIEQILDYGHLTISTASRADQLEFRYLPHPQDLQFVILSQKEKFQSQVRRRKRYEKRRAVERALGDIDEVDTDEADAGDEPPQRSVPAPLFDRLIAYLNPFNLREERSGGAILWRKHWIVLIGRIFWALLFMSLWVVGFIIGLVALQNDALSVAVFLVTASITFVIGVVWLYWVYEDWRNDVYILTQDAVVDEERLPLGFEASIRRAPLDTIQDISYEIPNPLYTILNVGDVLIQTAGIEGQLTFDNIAQPRDVVREIYERLRAREEEAQAREQQQRDEAIAEMLALYDQIRQEQF